MLPLLLILICSAAFAQEANPVQINFNLVQVNKYASQDQVLENVATPGQRVVIDVGNGETMLQYLAATAKVPVRVQTASYVKETPGSSSQAMVVDWETYQTFVAPSGADSFRVLASRTGCPGTEVAPSVAVAFATHHGWSDPPIRFGPLTANTTCPLGKGFTLEVNSRGTEPPRVKLIEAGSSMYGKR